MHHKIPSTGPRPGLAVLFSALFLWGLTSPAAAADRYFFDKDHSEIRFYYSHGGVSEQSGEFLGFEGDVVLDESDPASSSVTAKIDAKSITTGVKRLDGELKGSYYFSAKDHPTITFDSTEIRQVGSRQAIIAGNLTIRGITKPVMLDVELRHKGEHPMGASLSFYKGNWMGIHATTTILRSDFGMESFVPVVSDRIHIVINAELKARKK